MSRRTAQKELPMFWKEHRARWPVEASWFAGPGCIAHILIIPRSASKHSSDLQAPREAAVANLSFAEAKRRCVAASPA